jgi:hypothetical protein
MTNQPVRARCGPKFVRIAETSAPSDDPKAKQLPKWLVEGHMVKIACRSSTSVKMDPFPAR